MRREIFLEEPATPMMRSVTEWALMRRLTFACLLLGGAVQAQQPIALTAAAPKILGITKYGDTDPVKITAQPTGPGSFSFKIDDAGSQASGSVSITPPASLKAKDLGYALSYDGYAQFSGRGSFTTSGRMSVFWTSNWSQDKCDSNPLKDGSFSCQIENLSVESVDGVRMAYFDGYIFYYNSSYVSGSYTLLVRMYYALPVSACTIVAVDHIEVVQVVQNVKNSVPLIAGRPTVARVFFHIVDPPQPPLDGVTGILRGFHGDTELSGSPKKAFGSGSARVQNSVQREAIDQSLNYELPPDWITGDLTLRAEATIPPCDTRADSLPIQGSTTVTFGSVLEGRQSWRIGWIPYCHLSDTACPDEAQIPAYAFLIKKLYPLAPNEFQFEEVNFGRRPGKPAVWRGNDIRDDKASEFKAYLASIYDLSESSSFDQLVGVLPQPGADGNGSTLYGTSDPNWFGNRNPSITDASFGHGRSTVILQTNAKNTAPLSDLNNPIRFNGATLVHELAHNLGRTHPQRPMASGVTCQDQKPFAILNSGLFTDWPYDTADIQEVGFEPEVPRVVPTNLTDFMSYCDLNGIEDWVSPWTYTQLALVHLQPGVGTVPISTNLVPAVSARTAVPALATSAQVLIRGSALRDGTAGSLKSVYNLLSGDSPAVSDPNGSHCIRFSGVAGPISDFCFTLPFVEMETGTVLDKEYFAVKAPLPQGVTRIALMTGGNEIASIAATSAPPQLSITSPAANDQWNGGTQTIAWTASDPDGAPLLFNVLYSADGGRSWMPLEIDLSETQYTFDPADINGGANVMFRVMATDGLNSTTADVGPITVNQTPVMQLAATPFDFGGQQPGTVVQLPFSVQNTGTGPLSLTVAGIDNSAFSSNPTGLTVPAGATRTLLIQWRVDAMGPASTVMHLTSTDPSQPKVDVTIQGAGANPQIAVAPQSLDFGNIIVNQTSDLTVSIANKGAGPLNIQSLAVTGTAFSLVSPPAAPFKVGDAAAQLKVRFAPTAVGNALKGTLTITSNDPSNGSVTVALSGSGVSGAPAIFVSPAFLDFGTVSAGQTKDLSVTITNKGNAPLVVSTVKTTGSAFSVTSSTPQPIAAGDSASVTVRFAPTGGGAQTGTLAIASNDPAQPTVSLNLTGSGQSTGGTDVVLKVDGGSFAAAIGYSSGNTTGYFVNRLTPPSYPATLKSIQIYFSTRADGLQLNAPFTLISTSNASGSPALTFGSGTTVDVVPATVKALDAFVTYAVPVRTITSGDFVVGFMLPNPSGIYPADLDVTSASQGRSYTSNDGVNFFILDSISPDLAGNFGIRAVTTVGTATGATSGIDVTPTSVDFGSVASGQTQTRTLTLRSTGTGTLIVTSLSLKNSAFTVVNPPQTPFNIGDASVQLTLRFAPTSAGAQSGSLVIVSSDTAHSPLTIPLTGVGTVAATCVAPPFGLVSWWAGDGNANDLTGGANGTLQGAASFVAGEVGQAFNFDGSTGYVQIGNPANLRLSAAMSISAWVNPRSIRIASAGSPMGAIVTKWAQNISDTSDSDSYGLWLVQSGSSINLFSAIHQSGGREPAVQGGNIPLNTWTHVAMTYDVTGQYVLYVNGQAVASASSPGGIFATNHNVFIGREDSYIVRPFDGMIDEVQIFHRALSASEIQGIYSAGGAGECKK